MDKYVWKLFFPNLVVIHMDMNIWKKTITLIMLDKVGIIAATVTQFVKMIESPPLINSRNNRIPSRNENK